MPVEHKKRLEYMQEYQRQYYERNKEKKKKTTEDYLRELKRWFYEEVTSKLACSECGENDQACLDFHHRDPSTKEAAVTKMITNHRSKEAILAEIAKCDVLCANCHRKHHWKHRKNRFM